MVKVKLWCQDDTYQIGPAPCNPPLSDPVIPHWQPYYSIRFSGILGGCRGADEKRHTWERTLYIWPVGPELTC